MKKPELQEVYTEEEFSDTCRKYYQQAIADLLTKPASQEHRAVIIAEILSFDKTGKAKSKNPVGLQLDDGIYAGSVKLLTDRVVQWKKQKLFPLFICLYGEVWASSSAVPIAPRNSPERQNKFSFCAMSADGKGSWRMVDFTRENEVIALGEVHDLEPYYTRQFFTPPSVLFSMYAAYNQALSFPGNQTVGHRKLQMQ